MANFVELQQKVTCKNFAFSVNYDLALMNSTGNEEQNHDR